MNLLREKNFLISASFFFFLFIGTQIICAQDDKEFKTLFHEAEYYVINEDYQKAISFYDTLLEMEPSNNNLHFLIGYCHYNADNPVDSAVHHLEKASLEINVNYIEGSPLEKSAPPLAFFLLAKTYQRAFKFDMAIEAFETYKSYLDSWAVTEREYVNRSIKSCLLAKKMVAHPRPVDWVLQDFPKASSESIINPLISGDGSIMIYKAKRETGSKIIMAKRQSGSWSEITMIDGDLGLSEDAYPTSLCYKGDRLYLVEPYKNMGDIYVSNYENGKWSAAEALKKPINSRGPETHASISADGNTLFFTSSRKDGWGGMDLYRSTKDEKGNWDDPENLGFGINTYYNEATPFISMNDSILYFSSEGLETMGGYDIFSAKLDDDGTFTGAENMGYPISTPDNDLFYNPGWQGTKSYYARISDDHNGTKAIYSIVAGEKPKIQELLADEDLTTVLTITENDLEIGKDSNKNIVSDSLSSPANALDTPIDSISLAETNQKINEMAEVAESNSIEDSTSLIDTTAVENKILPHRETEPIQRIEKITWPKGYAIQIIALKNPKEVSYFKGLGKVTMYPGKDGFYRYVIGQYDTLEIALAELKKVRANGHPTAFVRPFKYLYNIRKE